MKRDEDMPDPAKRLYGEGPLGQGARSWSSKEGWSVDIFAPTEAVAFNQDLEIGRRMPGWFAVGQDLDDALLCVELKSGRCALVEVSDLRRAATQEMAPSIEALLAQGVWISAQ